MKLNTVYNFLKQNTAVWAFLFVSTTLFLSSGAASSVNAAPVTDFNAGYIISDNIFTNSQSMNAGQIQTFLNSKVPTCETWHAPGYGQNPPFICLKDFSENGRSAAKIIYDTAQQYRINPQVLIVLLQKEQGLVTDTWPLNAQYRTATGYGCPDTAACDTQYYGFTNQVRWAATMFRAIMDNSPTWYTPYVLGNNYIQYNPNASCGGSTVNIKNRATQALYNYTPYQPNQSALNAGYSTGDSCGAYGNRNFYLYFKDWFGSPMFGNLVRTPESATVYLLSGDNKYPISDANILTALLPFGGISYVNQTYLDSKTSGPKLGRVIKGSGNSIYFYDAGIKLSFGSCAQVEAYGSSCADVITLEDSLVNLLASGPGMTNVFRTTSGKMFYIDGTKREVFDTASLTAAGINEAANVLNEPAINNLQYGIPIIRDSVIVTSRTEGRKYLSQNGGLIGGIPADHSIYRTFLNLPVGKLDQISINKLTLTNGFNGFTKDSQNKKYIIDATGKTLLSEEAQWPNSYFLLSDNLITQTPTSTQPVNSRFVKSTSSSTIYFVYEGKKYPIPSWQDFLKLHIDDSTELSVLAQSTTDAIPTATTIYAPGSLVKSNNSATVYVIKGILQKITLSSFAISDELGLSGTRTISQFDLDAYVTASENLDNYVSCGGKTYLANLGSVYEINEQAADVYGYTGVVGSIWDDVGCNRLKISSKTLSDYLFVKHESNKTIYYVDNGTKRPVSSMARFSDLGGTSSNLLIFSERSLQTLSNGSLI